MIIPPGRDGITFRPPSEAAYARIEVRDEMGRPVPHLVAKEGPSKRLMGIDMVLKDLGHVERHLSAAIAKEDDELTELRWHGAVIAYARAFVSADARGFKLEVKHVEGLGPAHMKTHHRVMTLRHEYIAHAGKNEEQRCMVILPLDGDLSAPVINQVAVAHLVATSPGRAELEQFLGLAQSLRVVVQEMFDRTGKAVTEHYSKKTPEELRRLAGITER